MTILRNPIRNVGRGVLRGPLQGRFGGGAPTILEQILDSPHLIEAWVPGVSTMYRTQGTQTVANQATLADDPVDRVKGLKGAFDLYSDTNTRRPLLKMASGVTWLEFDGSNDMLTTDPNGSLGSYLMASALNARFVRVSAFRRDTTAGILIGGAQTRADLLNGASLTMFGGTFNVSGVAPATGTDFTVTEDWSGVASATSRLFINGALMDTDNPYSAAPADPNGMTIMAFRASTTLASFADGRWYGTFLFDDFDADTVALARAFLADGYTA